MTPRNKDIDRREFLRRLGAGALTASAALTACKGGGVADGGASGEVPADKMTFRVTPTTGDRVSLLGYGCMRWPMKKTSHGEIIDQEEVNNLVEIGRASCRERV